MWDYAERVVTTAFANSTCSEAPLRLVECTSEWVGTVAADVGRLLAQALGVPFDGIRSAHAAAARSGLIQNSMLESRDFEQALASLERLALGPWARHV
jgi:hypothetical protein